MRLKTYFQQIDGLPPTEEKFTIENFLFVGDPVTIGFGMNPSSALELVNLWNNRHSGVKFWIVRS